MVKIKSIIKSFLFLLLLVLIGGWFAYRSPLLKQEDVDTKTATMKPEYIPIENSKPSYFMTVWGKIDPSLLKHLNSGKVTAEYLTTNEACEYFNGAMINRLRNFDYQINPDPKNGNFSINVPLDKILPGYCQWTLQDITYNFHYAPENNHVQKETNITIAFFATNGVQSHSAGLDKWSCGDNVCKLITTKTITNQLERNLSPFQNYHFQINFTKKELNHGNHT